ncbi:hypothetical protein [Microbacterium kunmingense]|uniref:hypothetical protein n=1 Tax=Microbacterium kunmingense TaxID=2915939 RepID=UPI003D760964
MTRRRFALALPALAVAGLLAALPTTVAAAAPPAPRGAAVDQIRLPDGFQPEGIAIDNRGTAYFGSLVDGDIYAPSRAQAICPIRPRSSRCRSRGSGCSRKASTPTGSRSRPTVRRCSVVIRS